MIPLFCTGCTSNKDIDINEYLVVNTEGYDGYGSASLSLDYEAMVNNRAKELNLSEDKRKELLRIFDYYTPFKIKYDTSETLKNGDTINVSWELDNKAVKTLENELIVDFKTDSYSVSINTLEPLKEFDPFAEMIINTNNSISGFGNIEFKIRTVINDNEVIWEVKHNGENGKLSNGDTLTLTITSDIDEELLAKTAGLKISSKTTEYSVGVLGEYVKDETIVKRITKTNKSVFDNIIKEWVVSGLNDENSLAMYREFENIGYVFYTNNQDDTNADSITESTIVAIYHIVDPVVEGGYYVFIALTDKFTIHEEYGLCLDNCESLPESFVYYDKETVRYSDTFGWRQGDEKMGFLCDKYAYAGHKDLKETIAYLDEVYGTKYQYKYLSEIISRKLGE